LDFFVLFSSISAIAGLPGQADYSAANAFIDAFAIERRRRKGDLTIAIEWSTLKGVGMTAPPLAEREPVPAHPLLQRVAQHAAEQTVFETTLRTAADWIVGEHRLKDGTALVPGTGYLEIAAAAGAAGIVSNSGFSMELSDVAFLAPLVVPDDVDRNFRVAVQRTGERASFVVAAEDGESWYQVASGKVSVAQQSTNGVEDLGAVRSRCTLPAKRRFTTSNHPHLSLGKRWNNIREVLYGQREAVGRLSLPQEVRNDSAAFRLHPICICFS
jgi:hypothetical protein